MRFWLRYIGWHGFAVALAMGVLLAYLLLNGESSWYVSALGTAYGICLLVGGGIYFITRHRALMMLRRMESPTATIDFSDEGVSTRSDLGRADLTWRGIVEIWKFPEVWLFFVAKGSYFTIPTESLAGDVREFVSQKSREYGVKMR